MRPSAAKSPMEVPSTSIFRWIMRAKAARVITISLTAKNLSRLSSLLHHCLQQHSFLDLKLMANQGFQRWFQL